MQKMPITTLGSGRMCLGNFSRLIGLERITEAVGGAHCCAGTGRSQPPAYGLWELATSTEGWRAHLLLSRRGDWRPLSEFTSSPTNVTRWMLSSALWWALSCERGRLWWCRRNGLWKTLSTARTSSPSCPRFLVKWPSRSTCSPGSWSLLCTTWWLTRGCQGLTGTRQSVSSPGSMMSFSYSR